MFKHTPEEARNLVADALESGNYKQGVMYLDAGGKMCCLGVACHLFNEVEEELLIEGTDDDHDEGALSFGEYGDMHGLPTIVREWLGIRYNEGEWDHDHAIDNKNSLASVNDSGMTFEEIAKLFRDPPSGMCENGDVHESIDT